MKTAVIYARYSSERQTEQSIEGQLRVCKEYAERNNILIVDTYIDRAMTGTNDNRPDFMRMIKDSAKQRWDYVLVYKLDRFSRNKYEMTMHKHTLQTNGVKILSAMENIPDTPEGIILESLLEGMNQYYSAELAQKVRRGQNESRKKGQFCGGGLPDGYMVDGTLHIHVNEERAKIINYIFEQYTVGIGVPEIISQLTAKGITNSAGVQYTKTGLYKILRNEKYIGIYRSKDGVLYDNIYPPIVPRDTFDRVNRMLQRNKNGKKSTQKVYLLRRKIKCGHCGSSINGHCGRSRNGRMVYYYGCSGRSKKDIRCRQKAIPKEQLENLILDTLYDNLKKPQVMTAMIKGIMAIQKEQNNGNPMLSVMQRERQQTETALNNLIKALENGIFSSTTNERLRELEARKADLDYKITVEESKTLTVLSENEICQYYNEALTLEPRLLVNLLIKQITLADNVIQIQFNSPITEGPDNSQGFSFYREVLDFPKTKLNGKLSESSKYSITLSVK